ncbi:MAG: hypothetical protein B7Y80_03835 [Hyphomicrobium sp. 32-62-53]|nr:MAG: hypothetical protein B7Y80_03835 [Hyphomicrobium sp. 32-62-53]
MRSAHDLANPIQKPLSQPRLSCAAPRWRHLRGDASGLAAAAVHISATSIADQPYKDGCGWQNAVRFSQVGGAKIGAEKLTCEMAAAMALWIEHEVQPLALESFGARVVSIGDMGIFDCRNIVGNPLMKNIRSQHATANAIDISGFTLDGGRQISVLRDWSGRSKEAAFLKEIHRRACRYFRVALGPEYNAAHKNHFHFDRGAFSRCK